MEGLLSQSAEQYRAAAGISRSDLEWIHPPRTPAHFKAKCIDKVIPDDETPALRFGSITHRAILEPDTMENAFHVKPEGMNFATKAGKEWKESRQPGLPIITSGEANGIKAVSAAVWRHPLASRLLRGAECERSAYADANGLLLKSRFDALPPKSNAIVDVKTCESADCDSVERSIYNYGYFRQAAFYLMVAKMIGLDRNLFAFVFVEKTPPYFVAVYQLADEVIEAGRITVNRDLQVVRNCMESGKWPGYGDGLLTAGVPMWAMKELGL